MGGSTKNRTLTWKTGVVTITMEVWYTSHQRGDISDALIGHIRRQGQGTSICLDWRTWINSKSKCWISQSPLWLNSETEAITVICNRGNRCPVLQSLAETFGNNTKGLLFLIFDNFCFHLHKCLKLHFWTTKLTAHHRVLHELVTFKLWQWQKSF